MVSYNEISLHGQKAPAATTDQILFTVPAGKSLVASSLVVCNTDAAVADDFILCVGICGGATSAATALYYLVRVAPKETFVATIGITLSDDGGGNEIVVQSTNGTLTYSLFGQVVPGVAQ